MIPPADELTFSPEHHAGEPLYQDAHVCLYADGDTARLFYLSSALAGAVGRAQGQSLLNALNPLKQRYTRQLCLHIQSSGANFQEPMEGLFYLNAFLEALWAYKTQGMHLRVLVSGWLFGGMALALATLVDEMVLAPSANLGLLGHRMRGHTDQAPIPSADVQPEHLTLLRLTNSA